MAKIVKKAGRKEEKGKSGKWRPAGGGKAKEKRSEDAKNGYGPQPASAGYIFMKLLL